MDRQAPSRREDQAAERALQRLKRGAVPAEPSALQRLVEAGPTVIPGLLQVLAQGDGSGRLEAIRLLAQIGGQEVLAPLFAALDDPDWQVRREAVWALARLGDPRSIAPLAAALGDWWRPVRQAAAGAIAAFGPAALPTIQAVLREATWPPALRAAASALAQIGPPAIPDLVRALLDENPLLRRLAAEALGQIGDARAVPHLIVALKDQEVTVRRAAAEALGQIGKEPSIPALLDALWDQAGPVRRAAAGALERLKWQPRWDETGAAYCAAQGLWSTCIRLGTLAVRPLLLFLQDEEAVARRAAASALGQIGELRALPALAQALQDPDALVRKAAAEALGALEDPRVLPLLAAALKEEPAEPTRQAMARQLRRLSVLRMGLRPREETPAPPQEAAMEPKPAGPVEEVAPPAPPAPPFFPWAVPLLNLSGLGLGYLYIRRRGRWLLGLLLLLGLVALAGPAQVVLPPPVAVLLPLPALLWGVVDGWRLARRPQEQGPALLFRGGLLLLLGLLLLAVEAVGLWVGLEAGRQALDAGLAAYHQADCRTARSHLQATLWFPLLPRWGQGMTANRVCGLLLRAEEALAAGDTASALTTYEEFLRRFPDSPPVAAARQGAAAALAGQAGQLADQGNLAGAIETGRRLLEEYPATAAGQNAPALLVDLYLEQAVQLESQGAYSEAIALYETVLGTYPQIPAATEALTAVVQAHRRQAGRLRDPGRPAEAIALYTRLLERYPREAAAATRAIAATHLEWAGQLRREQAYGAAVDHYQTVLIHYAETPAAQSAARELPVTYLEWGTHLRRAALYPAAIGRYQNLLDEYPDSPAAAEVPDEIAHTCLAWGQALYAQGQYRQAIETFALTEAYTDESALLEAARQGYEQAVRALAADRGEQGGQVMEEAVTQVCAGRPAASPAVALFDASRRLHSNSSAIPLPDDLRARRPGEFHYALCLEVQAEEVSQCPYSDGYLLVRRRTVWQLRLRDGRTAEVLAERRLSGPLPPDCPDVHPFLEPVEYLDGASPEGEAVLSWLWGVLP